MRAKKSKWGKNSTNIHDYPKMRQDWKGKSFEIFIMKNGFHRVRTVSGSHRVYKRNPDETITCRPNMNGAVAAAYIKKYALV